MSAWNLLGLIRDITRAKIHFVALTLRRTESSDPRALYSLVDPPWKPHLQTVGRRGNVKEASVLVTSMESPKGDNRPPHKALGP